MNENENDNFEYEQKNSLNSIIKNYGGAIIGALIALVLCFTKLYRLVLYVAIIVVGAIVGNYVQKNKPCVKEKLKEFIDKF